MKILKQATLAVAILGMLSILPACGKSKSNSSDQNVPGSPGYTGVINGSYSYGSGSGQCIGLTSNFQVSGQASFGSSHMSGTGTVSSVGGISPQYIRVAYCANMGGWVNSDCSGDTVGVAIASNSFAANISLSQTTLAYIQYYYANSCIAAVQFNNVSITGNSLSGAINLVLGNGATIPL